MPGSTEMHSYSTDVFQYNTNKVAMYLYIYVLVNGSKTCLRGVVFYDMYMHVSYHVHFIVCGLGVAQ